MLLRLIDRRSRFCTEQHFEAALQLLHPGGERHLLDLRFHVQRRERQIVLRRKRPQKLLLNRLLRHEQVDLHGILLTHPVCTRDALLQQRRVPGQVHIDDRIGSLKVEPRRARVGREEEAAGGIVLKLMDQLLALFLRDGAIEPHGIELEPLDPLSDEIQHRRPFGEEHDLARILRRQLLEQFLEPLELARKTGCLLVHQIGAVRTHARQQQRLLQPQQVHFRDVSLADNSAHDLHLSPVDVELLFRGRDPHDLRGTRRQIAHDRAARAAQQHGLQILAQPVEVPVAEHLAFVIHHAVPVEKPESRAESPVVDELDDGEKIVEPVLERCSGQHQREGRAQALHGLRRLRLPVLDALALIENDQIPFRALDRENIPQHLLVVADGEEAFALVLLHAPRGAAEHDLGVARRKAQDFAAPLGFDRGGADDQHFADAGFARQEFRDSDTLDGFAEPHVVGQDRPSRAGGEGDAVQLVGQEFRFQ